MIIQNLTWDANIAAFSMWIIIGLLTATSDFKLNSIFKGILIAFMVLLPSAILIGWKEPFSLIPIFILTIILGGFQGFTIERILKKRNRN